jgi:hypothetical protein
MLGFLPLVLDEDEFEKLLVDLYPPSPTEVGDAESTLILQEERIKNSAPRRLRARATGSGVQRHSQSQGVNRCAGCAVQGSCEATRHSQGPEV